MLPHSPRMPWPLPAASCLAMFAASCSGTTRAPFLIEMARNLEASLSLVANLMAMTSISWGIATLMAGAGSDRWGRRPFLVAGPVGLAACMFGIAWATGYLGVAAWATAGGACSGAFTGVVMAETSARVIDRQRGRALGWVMAGQSLTRLRGFADFKGVHSLLINELDEKVFTTSGGAGDGGRGDFGRLSTRRRGRLGWQLEPELPDEPKSGS